MQDILLQMKEEVMLKALQGNPKAILALDIKGAFDNVNHTAILKQLNSLNCSERTYKYIRDFLNGRKAIMKVGDLKTTAVFLSDKGTP